MPKLKELQAKYDELKGKAQGLAATATSEDRELTDDENVQIDAWLDEGETVMADIRSLQDRNTRDERLGRLEAFATEPQPRLTAPVNPNPPAEPNQTLDTRNDPSTRNVRITGGPDSTHWDSFGEMLQAVRHAASSPTPDRRLVSANDFNPQAAAYGLNEGVPSEGGFLVEQQTMAGLWQRAYENSAILDRLETIPIGPGFNGLKMNGINETSRADGSRFGGVQAYWRAEAAEVTASKPAFRQLELDLKDLMALYYATDQLLADTVALEGAVSRAVSSEMAFKLENSIINGTGAGQPLGLLNSGCVVTITPETGQAANSIVYENLIKMWARMWAPCRQNAVWLINQAAEVWLMQMTLDVGTGGRPVFVPPGGASEKPYGTIFGRPVIPVEYCAAMGTAGDIILADLSQILAIDKGGLQTASSMHVRFIYGDNTYRFTYRFDAQPIWNSALTPYDGGDTLSPFLVINATGR